MVHPRILLPLGLLLLLSCKEQSNSTASGPPTDHVVPEAVTGFPEEVDTSLNSPGAFVLDTTGLSTEPDSQIKLLLEGTYHKNEVWKGAEKKEWLGLYYENGSYVLRPTALQVNTVEDPVADNQGILSGREVVAADSNAVFLLTGLRHYATEVDTAAISRSTLPANKALTYSFKGKEYQIMSFGDSTLTPTGERRYTHYGWKAVGMKNGKKVEQLLAEDESFDDSIYVLLWAGDLDNDGIPDLLLDLSNHYNMARYTLFLSSMAERGKLYSKVAVFETVGC